MKLHIPRCKIKKSKHPSWLYVALVKLLCEKEKLRLRYRKSNNPRNKIEFGPRDRCNRYLNTCYVNYKRRIDGEISQNCEALW